VVISGSERAALVRVGNAGAARQVKEGEEINGWVLVSVAEDRVIVRRDSLELEVFLDYAGPTVGGRDRRDDSPAGPSDQQPE
jgi:hypothetical protein